MYINKKDMKTKIIFFCTHFQYGQFEKIVFETVASDSFESSYDVRSWLDDQIPSIHHDFDLDLVFDWIVIYSGETEEDVFDIRIKDSIKGKLEFKKPRKKSVKPKKVIETPEVKLKVKPKKEYPSVWIDPFGESYQVGFAMHNEWAGDWLEKHDTESYKRVTRAFSRYYYEELQDRGWVRILGWSDPPSFVIPDKVTPKLKSAIREYCLSSDVAYDAFPDILKS